MLSFAQEDREEYTGHVNPCFSQQRRARYRRPARWLPLSVRLPRSQRTSFVFFSLLDEWHWDRGTGWKGLLSPKHVVLRIPPKADLPCILQRFWITLSHVCIHSSWKQNNLSPFMTSQANLPHSSLLLDRRLINRTWREIKWAPTSPSWSASFTLCISSWNNDVKTVEMPKSKTKPNVLSGRALKSHKKTLLHESCQRNSGNTVKFVYQLYTHAQVQISTWVLLLTTPFLSSVPTHYGPSM